MEKDRNWLWLWNRTGLEIKREMKNKQTVRGGGRVLIGTRKPIDYVSERTKSTIRTDRDKEKL